ncbi:MAG: DUF3368 domain-containing protein [Acidobacteria bacterium]|nr:DUF3368 domain-containing protein [Acidobacteriota bacterium]
MIRSIVIADASSLIALDNISELDVLRRLYNAIIVTPEVAGEYGLETPAWIHIRAASNRSRRHLEASRLDSGEISSIALALDSVDPLLIIDERKGRRVAEQLGIDIIGIVGVLIKAKLAGFIRDPETLLDRLESVDFRLSDALKARFTSDDPIH